MKPSQDRTSTKYHDRTWYSGRWMTIKQIELQRQINRNAVRKYRTTTKGIVNDWNTRTNQILGG